MKYILMSAAALIYLFGCNKIEKTSPPKVDLEKENNQKYMEKIKNEIGNKTVFMEKINYSRSPSFTVELQNKYENKQAILKFYLMDIEVNADGFYIVTGSDKKYGNVNYSFKLRTNDTNMVSKIMDQYDRHLEYIFSVEKTHIHKIDFSEDNRAVNNGDEDGDDLDIEYNIELSNKWIIYGEITKYIGNI